MKTFGRNSQEGALSLLGEVLAGIGERPIHLLVSGGAALLATGLVSRVTNDVDVLGVIGEIDRELDRCHRLPEFVSKAVRRVADEMDLRPNWLNASAGLLMIGFDRFPPGVILADHVEREFGSHLKITFIGRKGQLYLKMFAACGRDEDRDIEDLRALELSVEEAEEVATWIFNEELVDIGAWEEVFRVLKAIGHEGVIRRVKREIS
ncbi:MAG: hypothetical protein AAGA96_08000 [Verrucomicrobiota bacterium]